MSARQLLAAGGAAILLLLGGSLLVLGPRGGVDGSAAPEGPGAGSSGALRSAGLGPGDLAPAPAPLPPAGAAPPTPRPQAFQPSVRGLPSAGDEAAWGAVPVAVKLADLGPLAAPVNASLELARRDMDPCFQAEASAPDAGAPGPAAAEPPTGPAILVLRLESRERGLDVVGTELESSGSSSRALVECCQAVLHGWSVAADAARPGRRYRLKLLLQ